MPGECPDLLLLRHSSVLHDMAERIIDHAIQSYGGAGVSQDTPLASLYAGMRTLRIVDGPDEVHIRDIARLEIKPYLS